MPEPVHGRSVKVVIGMLLVLSACASPPVDPDAGGALAIEPGVGVGPISLGMRYADVVGLLGEAEGALVVGRIAFARYPEHHLELVLTSPEESTLTGDAIVVGLGVAEGASVRGPVVPGALRSTIERALGSADVVESFAFYPAGLSVEYDGDRAVRVGVIAPYDRRPEIPEMTAP